MAIETINTSTGAHVRTTISQKQFNDWGEIQRTFMFNPTSRSFHLCQTNFTSGSDSRPIILWTIDALTGDVEGDIISGGVMQQGDIDVTGYAFNPGTGLITMSVQFFPKADIGYSFWEVDPTTAVATLKSSIANSTDTYAGWFDTISVNGGTVYRLGYQNVVDQLNPGLGITDISTPKATTRWISNLPIPEGLGFYLSINLVASSGIFASLAPDQASGDLSLVSWSINGTANVVTKLVDAYNTPEFGPIVEWIGAGTYGALVVHDAVPTDLDSWMLVLVDLASGATTQVELTPTMLAKVTSVSALGF